MSVSKLLKEIFVSAFGKGVKGTIDGLKSSVNDTMEEIEHRVQRITNNAVKSMILFFIFFLGSLFVLIGLGIFLTTTYPVLDAGRGYILLGGIILVLGLVSKALQKS